MAQSVSFTVAILIGIISYTLSDEFLEGLDQEPAEPKAPPADQYESPRFTRSAKYYPDDDDAEVINGKQYVHWRGRPYHINFSEKNVSIFGRQPVFRWTFASDDCMPQITCPKFHLFGGSCTLQYLEVTDGVKSYQRYCGDVGPNHTIAAPGAGVRDIYVTFKNFKHEFPVHFECEVTCGQREKAHSMKSTVVQKVDELCTCGRRANRNRIIGGTDTYWGEYPWIAAMVVANTRQPYCIGSVINDRMILTAAHCFKGKYKLPASSQVILNAFTLDPMPNVHILKGATFMTYDTATLHKLDAGNGSWRFQVDKIIIHPLYSAAKSDFDTALMLLSKPIDKSLFTTYSPICLPDLKYNIDSYTGWTATISGWGLPSSSAVGTLTEMQQIEVKIHDAGECAEYFGDRWASPRRQLCAAHPNATQDSCAGDSGGPLILAYRPQVWYQVGIISWGDGCAVLGHPGVYYRTTSTNQWIRFMSNIKESVWCSTPK